MKECLWKFWLSSVTFSFSFGLMAAILARNEQEYIGFLLVSFVVFFYATLIFALKS